MLLYDELNEMIEEDFANKLIKLSKMVEEGKLNSTGAKVVFRKLMNNYKAIKEKI
jgi:polyhydroxyalkanoate synthesis regulator phasin